MSSESALPSSVTDAVLVPSEEVPAGSQKVEELDFNKFHGRAITVDDLMSGMNNMGFQATSIGEAVRIINDMVSPLSHMTFIRKSSFVSPLLLHFLSFYCWKTSPPLELLNKSKSRLLVTMHASRTRFLLSYPRSPSPSPKPQLTNTHPSAPGETQKPPPKQQSSSATPAT